ncbi:hypothetical protein pEaSNUABM29_00002 [Erwinia phage pEa_SNUABM_29]|nr:hypothetical protein pEaSNUABM29_00002 [Erwinia phage pEa_SNUABM_29]
MTIRLSWPSQASKALTSIEIYRKTGYDAVIDVNNPGTPVATLPGNATEYVENVANLTEKTMYSYWVASVKGTERVFGAKLVQPFYLDVGPGPQAPIRGDWYCGYFGVVSTDDFINRAEIQAQLSTAQASMFQNGILGWHKFIYKGRIVYFPTTQSGQATFLNIYGRGMVYGTDDNGAIVPTGVGATSQNTRVSKAGRQYRVRLPYALDYNSGGGNTAYDEGEWRMTMARLYNTGYNYTEIVDKQGRGQGKLDGLALLSTSSNLTDAGCSAMAPPYAAGTMFYNYAYNPNIITTTNSLNVNVGYFLALELILP